MRDLYTSVVMGNSVANVCDRSGGGGKKKEKKKRSHIKLHLAEGQKGNISKIQEI